MALAFEMVGSVTQIALLSACGHHLVTEGLNRTKNERERIYPLPSCLLSWASISLLLLTWIYTIPWFLVLCYLIGITPLAVWGLQFANSS